MKRCILFIIPCIAVLISCAVSIYNEPSLDSMITRPWFTISSPVASSNATLLTAASNITVTGRIYLSIQMSNQSDLYVHAAPWILKATTNGAVAVSNVISTNEQKSTYNALSYPTNYYYSQISIIIPVSSGTNLVKLISLDSWYYEATFDFTVVKTN